MKNFYNLLGFERDPFFITPVEETEEGNKGFIDRLTERNDLDKHIQKRSGFLLIVGNIGVGKSSLMKRGHFNAIQHQKEVISLNALQESDITKFLSAILNNIKEEYNKDSIKNLLVYINSNKNNLDTAIKNVLSFLKKEFTKKEYVLIIDDTDKLDDKDFKEYIDDIISIIPSNLILIATANTTHLKSKQMTKNLLNLFSEILLINPIETTKKLQEFIDGRIKNYSFNSKPIIFFGNKLYELLLERAQGNLRETYRYLGKLLTRIPESKMDNPAILGETLLIDVIKEVDNVKALNLTDDDFIIIKSLLENKELDLYELKDYIKNKSKGLSTIWSVRGKVENLCQEYGFLFKRIGTSKTGRGNKTLYYAPPILGKTLIEKETLQ